MTRHGLHESVVARLSWWKRRGGTDMDLEDIERHRQIDRDLIEQYAPEVASLAKQYARELTTDPATIPIEALARLSRALEIVREHVRDMVALDVLAEEARGGQVIPFARRGGLQLVDEGPRLPPTG
jgi:hypothetical protein